MQFVKGHGTENDFVLLPDPGDELTLDAELVAAICNRRTGIGADGVLRIAPSSSDAARWFMDYRNADGSLAEMCGNGIRVFGRYLVDAGLDRAGRIPVETRAGMRNVDVPPAGDVTAEMGVATRGPDASVTIGGQRYDGVGWSLGNPHLVVTLADAAALAGLDLSTPPTVDPAAFPTGVNVEFLVVTGEGQIAMRVHERGSGETRSCGTGACAAAVAVMAERGERTSYDVDVPGGRVRVTWDDAGAVTLTGPAVLVASGEIDLAALGSSSPARVR